MESNRQLNEGGEDERMFGDAFNRFPIEERVMPRLMIDAAERFGDRTFASLPGGELTFAEVPQVAASVAAGLRRLGVGPGSRIAILTENCIEFPAAAWGQAWNGGSTVTLNYGLRPPTVARMMEETDAEVLIVTASKLAEGEGEFSALPALRAIVVVDSDRYPTWPGPTFLRWADLIAGVDPVPAHDLNYWDPAIVCYTSGTTGVSKGVVMSHHHTYCYSVPVIDRLEWGTHSRLFTPMPLFHAQAHLTVLFAGFVAGAFVRMPERFSASQFWPEVVKWGAKHVSLNGTAGSILLRQPRRPEETEHNIETFVCAPVPPDYEEFRTRFKLPRVLWHGYGQTEVYPIQRVLDQPEKGPLCLGRPGPLFEMRIHDEHDREVPADGESTGEIVLRPRLPHSMMTEYLGRPEATAKAFKNLWYHTGDVASMDGEGYLFLRGRTTDSIRRRGENISAFELEREILMHTSVEQVAAYGVPSDLGEEDVKVDVVVAKETSLDPEELLQFLAQRVPKYMLPRYVQLRTNFPMTASQRVQKYLLIEEGVAEAYDAEPEGKRKAAGADPLQTSTTLSGAEHG